jgi:NAD(P)-dependent dehydrogenase (short-subunit alcohol dehydrogenase family)
MTVRAARRLVVTGASSGIGRAIALRAANEGWRVLATVRSKAQRQQLEEADCDTAILELRDGGSIEAFAEIAKNWCEGRLDALVNNAGTSLPGPVEELRLGEVRELFEVNVFGHLQVTQRLLPALRASSAGRIVFVSSAWTHSSVPLYGAYVASKRALNAFAESLAAEVQSSSVSVAILELGSFETDVRTKIRARLESAERAGTSYGELLRGALSSLGKPPIGSADMAASVVLSLLEQQTPPLVSVFRP